MEEIKFEHSGLNCKAVLTEGGWWCGYVGVSEKHPLYKVMYTDKVLVPTAVRDRPIDTRKVGLINLICADVKPDDKEIDLVLAVDVHGGLSFSNYMRSGTTSGAELWWFGFDCAHLDDALTIEDDGLNGDVWRDENFVVTQCRELAKQLVVLGEFMAHSPVEGTSK